MSTPSLPPNLILNQKQEINTTISVYSTIDPSMSAKRTAPYAIDEKTLEPIEKNDAEKERQEPAERTILKVKEDKDNKQEKKEENKGLIFANLFKNNGVGLFNNTGLLTGGSANAPEFKVNLNASNLFANNGFANNTNNLFSKPAAPTQTANLFQNTGKSIFGFGNGTVLPPVRAGEEEDEGDSDELEKNQDMKIDKSKSTGKYEYKDEMKVLFCAHAKKYKKNDGDLIENVEAIVQLKQDTKYSRLVVRLPATKHSILIGTLVRGKCEVRTLNKKDENLELSVFVFEEGKQSSKEKIKLQFQNGTVGKEFLGVITSLISPEESSEKNEEAKEAKDEKEVKEK